MPGQNGRPLIHSQRITASAELDAEKDGMWIVGITVIGGTTPGTLSIRYNGRAQAHFPAPTSGYAHYDVNEKMNGQTIPAASVAFNGGIAAAVVHYADAPNTAGKPLSGYRAVRGARTDGGATTADVTFTFDEGPESPKFVSALISASNGRAVFQAVGPLQARVEASPEEFRPALVPAPDLPKAADFVASVVTDGAATIQIVAYY